MSAVENIGHCEHIRDHASILFYFTFFSDAFPTVSPQHVCDYMYTVPTDLKFCLGFGVSSK